MVRFMKTYAKHRGGMIKTLKGMVALKRRGVRGSGVRPQIGMFKQLTVSSTVKPVKEEITGEGVKSKKQSYKSLKFNL
jgi:hypothetical protein